MRPIFEELDRQPTPMGDIHLRRRLEPTLRADVYEAILGDEHLMSSLFTVAEVELARLGLAALDGAAGLDVVVGGLGLGYTALATLEDERVRSLVVVEALDPVIDWHRRSLLPLSDGLAADPRCHLALGDFFALVAAGSPFVADGPAQSHAILLDVDHAPDRHLHPSHAALYQPDGLARLAGRLHPGGAFALWSDDPPDDAFVARLDDAFAAVAAHVVEFANHHTGGRSTNTVYVATTAGPTGRGEIPAHHALRP